MSKGSVPRPKQISDEEWTTHWDETFKKNKENSIKEGEEMQKLLKVTFEYEDGTVDRIDDPRAAAVFQSRCNSGGVLAGIEFSVRAIENELKDKNEQTS